MGRRTSAEFRFKQLKSCIDKLSKQEGLDKWYRYGLEDMQEDIATADTNHLTLAQVKEWQEELGEIEADYALAMRYNIPIARQTSANNFFKTKQPMFMPEQAPLSQGNIQPRITA